jgi:cytochrome c
MGAKKKKAEGDAGKGEKIFKNLCAVCHSMGAHGTGPQLKGAYGSLPGKKEGFGYSSSMKAVDKKWNDSTLDKYLKAPAEAIPGNAMAFAGIPSGKDRGDVIAYLKANA